MDRDTFGSETFSRRDAFLWLVENASWKRRQTTVAGRPVTLEPGQIVTSNRFLAQAWGWSEAKVRRIVGVFKTDALIDAASDAGMTRITVRNYGVFCGQMENADAASDAEDDAEKTQPRRKLEKGKNTTSVSNDTSVEGGAPVSEPVADAQSDPSPAGSSQTSTPPIQTSAPQTPPEEFDLIPLALDQRPEALAVKAYNAMAERAGLAQVQKLHDTRKAKLLARLKDCGGLEGWAEALRKVKASPFLTGQNDRGWRADFDFLMRESSFTKLMEGAYDGRPGGGGGGDGFAQALRELATTDNDGGPII